MMWTTGSFKQELSKDYNDINFQMFDIGVKRQKIDIIGDKVLIIAEHKRISSLKYLDETNRLVTRMTDIAIIDDHKEYLKKIIEKKYNMTVRSIMKDYDPYIELTATVIIFDIDVSTYISDL